MFGKLQQYGLLHKVSLLNNMEEIKGISYWLDYYSGLVTVHLILINLTFDLVLTVFAAFYCQMSTL